MGNQTAEIDLRLPTNFLGINQGCENQGVGARCAQFCYNVEYTVMIIVTKLGIRTNKANITVPGESVLGKIIVRNSR